MTYHYTGISRLNKLEYRHFIEVKRIVSARIAEAVASIETSGKFLRSSRIFNAILETLLIIKQAQWNRKHEFMKRIS